MPDKSRMSTTTPGSPGWTPRVSILIPNYNNGRQSSASGQRDFLGDLLQSLWDTLHDDPTPFEIICYDDGSTDDSLATARLWAGKSWPQDAGGAGRPFMHLVEAPHCGVLAKTANVMSRMARGEFLARLDGDTVMLTRHWVSILARIFDHLSPSVGVIGPKQLTAEGNIHAFGDWILHPNGYTHVGQGLPRHAFRTPLEVDHTMGCFYCCRKKVYEDVGGYDESFLRGQTIDVGIAARLKGWRCFAVPDIEYIHAHGHRKQRPTTADTNAGIARTLQTFRDKWGFCRLTPDMDEIRRRYRGTPLLWNARWFGSPASEQPADVPPPSPLDLAHSEWGRYAGNEDARKFTTVRVMAVLQTIEQLGKPQRPVIVGGGAGLVAHLLATKGISCLSIDRHQPHIDLAQRCIANQKYPGQPPTCLHHPDCRTLPLPDDHSDLTVILDQLEIHPNPVALLREARRITAPGKTLVIVSRRKPPHEDRLTDGEHRFRFFELINFVRYHGGFTVIVDPKCDDPHIDMVVVARVDKASAAAPGQAAPTPVLAGIDE